MLKRISALLLPLAVGLLVAGVISAQQPSQTTVALQPGHTALTWSGAEPYAIANFADTPVTKIHRFDPVRQRWLSHAIGQDNATLPELHLLPRVQYLLKSDAAHELTIPNPLADIDPLARLRYPSAPDDPLRFEAYWPNEDSPLEDLVVLRGEDERLSVKAWVAGGVGDISVWWMIDGRVNHAGLASDDVELLPGGHDDAMLFAADESGQVKAVSLPRVVKLPPLELPEMQYGVLAHIGSFSAWFGSPQPYQNPDSLRAALDLMRDAGLTMTMADFTWDPVSAFDYALTHLDLVARELELRDMDMIAIVQSVEMWASAMDLTSTRELPWGTHSRWRNGPWHDPKDKSQEMLYVASRWSDIRYWMVAHESNVDFFYSTGDVVRLVNEIRAAALGAYYANPEAVIVAPGLTGTAVTESFPGEIVAPGPFLQSLYDLDFHRYVDVVAIHPFVGWHGSVERTVASMMAFVEDVRAIMEKNDDADRALWATSHGWGTGDRTEGMFVREDVRAELLVEAFRALADSKHVSAALIYNFRDTLHSTGGAWGDFTGIVEHDLQDGSFVPKPAYWAIREFITGQPPPE